MCTETLDPPWPMESPDPSWLPEALDLPWPPKLPASGLETICALSASCVSVSSRSQSLPWVSAPPCLLRCGDLLPCLLRPGGLQFLLFSPGGLLSRLLRPGGLRSRLLRPSGLRSRLPHMDLALRLLPRFYRPPGLFCVERLEAALWGGGALSRIRFMSSCPLTTLSLAPHYSYTSPTDCISHPPLY